MVAMKKGHPPWSAKNTVCPGNAQIVFFPGNPMYCFFLRIADFGGLVAADIKASHNQEAGCEKLLNSQLEYIPADCSVYVPTGTILFPIYFKEKK